MSLLNEKDWDDIKELFPNAGPEWDSMWKHLEAMPQVRLEIMPNPEYLKAIPTPEEANKYFGPAPYWIFSEHVGWIQR